MAKTLLKSKLTDTTKPKGKLVNTLSTIKPSTSKSRIVDKFEEKKPTKSKGRLVNTLSMTKKKGK